MYHEGQKVVVRDNNGSEKVSLVEDVISDNGGQMLRVKDLDTGVSRVVNPQDQPIVEHLED
jgi:hypothetical protein